MAASANDLFQKLGSSSSIVNSPRVTATRSGGGASLTVDNCNWDTTTGKVFATYQINTSGAVVAGTQIIWKGVVTSSTGIGSMTRLMGASDTGNAIGDVVELLPASYWANNLVDGLLQDHSNPSGYHKTLSDTNGNEWIKQSATASAVNEITVANAATGNAPVISATGDDTNVGLTLTPKGTGGVTITKRFDGWTTGLTTPNTVTCNGNRSYDLVFNSTDLTGFLSAGQRLKLTRTVTAPTQCTSLNGTTQYYSKASPNGMTFTDDFVVSAWVKLTSYANSIIASRYNGTSGWYLNCNASGQIVLVGTNAGAANFSQVISYQSIPLNKWVHVTAQLDMSTFTATTTTSYVMLDGVDVPASVTRGGTNPTALIQAGNLEIGSYNGGSLFFPGKIAQVAIYSAKVTQANVRATISQGLSGSETSLISAYSFNNSINDLNANANNLTANGSAVATNADSPFGQQADGTTAGTTEYAIITKAAFSTNTTLTVQVPEGNAIPTSGGVSAVSYSSQKAPYGMPVTMDRWRVRAKYTVTTTKSSPTNATAYNNGEQITVPVGQWVAGYKVWLYQVTSASTFHSPRCDLNATTATYTATSEFSGGLYLNAGTEIGGNVAVRGDLSVTSATPYYLNVYDVSGGTVTSINLLHTFGEGNIYLEPAFL